MRLTAILCAAALLAIALSSGVAADTGETAVVDRLESGQAVLLIESDGETTDQRVVDVAELPAEGRHEGAVLRLVDGTYVYDEAETERRTSDAGDTFERLADSDDGSDGRIGGCRFGLLSGLWWC